MLDDVRIYNQVLTAEEISELYNNGDGTEKHAFNVSGRTPIAHWTMNDNAADTVVSSEAEVTLTNADITYPDGTIQEVHNGKVTKITKPDGTEFHYDAEERIEYVMYPNLDDPDGPKIRVDYLYGDEAKDAEGNVFKTAVNDSEKNCYYDENDRLAKVEFKNEAGEIIKTIEYTDGILSKVTEGDYIYTYNTSITGEGETTEYKTELFEISYGDNRYFIEDNNIVQIKLSDYAPGIYNLKLKTKGEIINQRIIIR